MAWTTPVDQSTGFLVTASVYNTQIIDNITYLHNGLPGTSYTNILNPTTSYSAPANTTGLYIKSWGAGGAGGGAPSNVANNASVGGGGAAGSYAEKLLLANIGTHTTAVGVGGTGVSAGTGNTGGNTTFQDSASTQVCTGTGGVGGGASTSTASSAMVLGGAKTAGSGVGTL